MAAGELHMDRIILGAALGIGAIAAAPFTGGGSVLGAATLVTGKQRKSTERNSKRRKKSTGRWCKKLSDYQI